MWLLELKGQRKPRKEPTLGNHWGTAKVGEGETVISQGERSKQLQWSRVSRVSGSLLQKKLRNMLR